VTARILNRENSSGVFAIEICYSENSDAQNPGRIFLALSKLIDSIYSLEQKLLVSMASVEISPILVVEDIHKGSVLTWLYHKFKHNEETGSFDADKTAEFLSSSVRDIIKCAQKEDLNADDVRILRMNLLKLAEKTNPTPNNPIYIETQSKNILAGIQEMQLATSHLEHEEKANFIFEGERMEILFPFDFSGGAIEDLLTKETIVNEQEMILKIKGTSNNRLERSYNEIG
jgi:hypothetical protein